jgi:hypothetical protein
VTLAKSNTFEPGPGGSPGATGKTYALPGNLWVARAGSLGDGFIYDVVKGETT